MHAPALPLPHPTPTLHGGWVGAVGARRAVEGGWAWLGRGARYPGGVCPSPNSHPHAKPTEPYLARTCEANPLKEEDSMSIAQATIQARLSNIKVSIASLERAVQTSREALASNTNSLEARRAEERAHLTAIEVLNRWDVQQKVAAP